MSFKTTVIMIFWIVVAVIIIADLIYIFTKNSKNRAIAAGEAVDTGNVDIVEEVNKEK